MNPLFTELDVHRTDSNKPFAGCLLKNCIKVLSFAFQCILNQLNSSYVLASNQIFLKIRFRFEKLFTFLYSHFVYFLWNVAQTSAFSTSSLKSNFPFVYAYHGIKILNFAKCFLFLSGYICRR